MTHELRVQRNELVHVATFDRPVVELWNEGKTIVQGLLDAFLPFGASLGDIRNESASLNPADQVVAVNIGLSGVHRFRFDRLESVFFNFEEDFLGQVPQILSASTNWIHKAAPSVKFLSHQFTYSSHSEVGGKRVDDLMDFANRSIPAAGASRGTGVIFNWEIPDRGWTTKLLLDRSIVVPDGFFMMFSLVVKTDRPDYASLVGEARSYLEIVLKDLGFRLV